MNKNIEIIGMIYKSVDYLNLIYNELTSDRCKVDGYDISLCIIANDANQRVLDRLNELPIKKLIYNDKNPNDYYLNRVYRAWNYGGKNSQYDNICFINSDMIFGHNWLTNLLKHHDGINIPCSRLVESGKMISGKHGISQDFGRHANHINHQGFDDYSNNIKVDKVDEGGLYMPCVFETKRFIESGMYPEGNVNGQSGDDYFFKKLEKEYGMKHITVMDSIVYHIQEGEMDE